MSRRLQDALLVLRGLSDLFMVCTAWVLAYHLRFASFVPAPKGIPEPTLYYKLLPFIGAIWFAVLAASGFYRRTGRHRSAFTEGLDILQSCILATLAFIAFTWAYEEYRYSRVTVVIFALIHPWMIITGRSLIRKALRFYRRKAPPRRSLVIGSGDSLRHALDMSRIGDVTRGEVAGAIVIGNAEEAKATRELLRRGGIKEYEVPTDWIQFFSEHPTESVIFALPHRHYSFLDEHLEKIADQVPDIKLVPDVIRYTRFAAGVDVVNGTPVVQINDSPLEGMGSIIKRLMDIVGALVGITLFSPVMIVLAILVKATSRGPVFYRQTRMGLDGRNFEVLKFRSMPVDAEAKTGAIWAKPGDDRATPIGRFMRRTSLDELPQFFNVLKGEMSLVGPRPERPVFVEQFRRQVPGYYLRHKVKAGITGWAQVNGWRGDTSIEKRIECDLFYIQNWSVWLDLRIILLTIFRGFISKNAY